MSHFYASIQGSLGEANRCGTQISGMSAHVRGWDVGARIELSYNAEKDEDEVTIYLTSGSNNRIPSRLLGVFTRDRTLTNEELKQRDPRLSIGEARRVE